jgi:hypothetical protein
VTESEFTLLPPWRNAAKDLFSGRYGYGDVVPHEELQEALGLPKPAGKVEVEDVERWRLALLSQMDALSTFLLEERSICLRVVPGVGYQIVEPENQTAFAMKEGMRKVQGELRKMGRRLSHVNRTKLTAEQARENADALARLAFLSQQTSKVRRLRFTE